jgi:transcriptional regulator with XRE-family HTH domain
MPRPEKPVNPGSLLGCFALGLRDLRRKSGLTYREMAEKANFCVTSLSGAAAGQSLPTLEVTLAYVNACGGSQVEWRARWNEARGNPDGGGRE